MKTRLGAWSEGTISPAFRLVVAVCALLLALFGPVRYAPAAESARIGIVYPQVEEPAYREVFDAVVAAAQRKLESTGTDTLTLDPAKPDPAALRKSLDQKTFSALLTLGRQGYTEYQESGSAIPAVSGLFDLSANVHPRSTGISLSVDPLLYFDLVKRLLPQTKRIFIIFDPAKDSWLVDLAKRGISRYRMELVAYPESEVTPTFKRYLALIKEMKPHEDALWLPMDARVINDSDLLDRILNASWDRYFPVFSNSLAHARKGATFVLYPDAETLGGQLADMTLKLAQDHKSGGIEPLRAVRRAVNRRFAEHLGIELKGDTANLFDTKFGRPGE